MKGKKMNTTNWPIPNVWVFIADMVEHYSANGEAMGSNPVEVSKFFSGSFASAKIVITTATIISSIKISRRLDTV